VTDAAEPAETPDPYDAYPRRDEAHLTGLHRERTRRRTRNGDVGRLTGHPLFLSAVVRAPEEVLVVPLGDRADLVLPRRGRGVEGRRVTARR
jgi:hypothetical protein